MSISYNTSIVRDGLLLYVDANNPKSIYGPNLIPSKGSLSDFPANQSVSITQVGRFVQATSNQNTSTPGVWPISNQWITVSANTQYTFRALASVAGGSTAWLYVAGNVNGNLVWQGTALTSTHQWIENTFDTGSNTQLKVGILWSSPSTGSSIFIEDIALHKVSMWYDISGNDRHGTKSGSPTWASNNGGVFQFNGSNSIQFNNINLASGTSTVLAATRYTGATRGRMVTAINNNWLLGYWSTTTENYYAEGWVSSVSAGTNDTSWRILAATGDTISDTWKLYVNNSLTVSNSNGSAGPNGLQVPQSGGEQSIGECGFIMAYNRVLSASEIAQNFNAHRDRYGI